MPARRLLVVGLTLCFSVQADSYVYSQRASSASERVITVSDVPDTIAWRMFFLKVTTLERDDRAFCRTWLMRILASNEVWHGKFDSEMVETIVRISQEQVNLLERYIELSKQTRAALRAVYEQSEVASKERLDEVQIGFSSGIADEMLVFSECMRLKSALTKVFGDRGTEAWEKLFEHVRLGKANIQTKGVGEDQKRELQQVNAALPWNLSFRVFPNAR